MRARVLPALGLTVAATVAHAQPAPPIPAPPPERSISLTVSPFHLLFPILEVTGELRLGPKLGAAGIVGAGSIGAETSTGDDLRFFAAELGASVRYYATGSFASGLQVGAEVLFIYLKLDETTTDFQLTAGGDGLSVGPFVGYKWTARGGLTLDGQLGVAVAATESHAASGGSTAADADSRVHALLNLNAGWSF